MHTGQGSPAGRLIGAILVLAFLIPLGYFTWRLGSRSFLEAMAHGYGLDRVTAKASAFEFLVPLFAPKIDSGQASDAAREDFNAFLRFVSLLILFLLTFVLSAQSIEGIATERAKDTWTALLTTPLDGNEILRAKRLGVLWKHRLFLLLPMVLWTFGLLAGALHPVGFLAALIGLGLTAWFLTTWGTYCALVYPEAARASNLCIGVVILLQASALLPIFLHTTVLLGSLSNALNGWLMMVSYRDVRSALRAGTFPPLDLAGIMTGEGPARVAAAWCLGMVVLAAGAVLSHRAASRRFDVAADRPRRRQARGMSNG